MENARLWFENEDTSLSVRHFRVEEAMSGLFRVRIRAVSPRESLNLGSFVGSRAEFQLSGSRERRWRGLCIDMALVRIADDKQGLATYELTIAPTLFRLTQRRNNRLFQHSSIPEIVSQILAEWRIPHAFRINPESYPKLELRTQYGETDHAFVSRLLEEAGIAYWFEDEGASESTLVLGDEPQANAPREGDAIPFVDDTSPAYAAREEFVTRVRLREESRPGRVALRDYDFWRPQSPALVSAASDREEEALHEQYHYVPGQYLREVGAPQRAGIASQISQVAAAAAGLGPGAQLFATGAQMVAAGNTPVADDMGVARFRDEFGQQTAQRMIEALHADRSLVTFETNLNDLRPATVFAIAGHPHEAIGAENRMLMTHFLLEGEVAKPTEWRFAGSAVLAARAYRPPRVTAKPRIYGLQTAVVVGSGLGGVGDAIGKATQAATAAANMLGGELGEAAAALGQAGAVGAHLSNGEIYVDEHGRVRVQFPWDREHAFNSQSSIWMRVSQGWAGGGYGLFTIPRVGQEVLVAFIDGDPDCPMVVGRVHNVLEPVPFKLPENKTVSTWKTQSSPGGGGFNELRFDDAAGREHVYLQAQKDMDQLVKNDSKAAVGRDRSNYVQRDDAHAVGRDRTKFVNQNELEATGLNRSSVVGLNRTSTIGVEDSTQVGTRWSVTVARGLTRRLPKELEKIAGNVGGVMRSAATAVLGMMPNDPLAKAAEATLSGFGRSAFERLNNALRVLDGFGLEPGPAPTSIEMVDRQIKLSTGEASITLDGPNVTIAAQGAIVFHAIKGISILGEQEVAIAGREKVAVVSANDDVIIQAAKDVHLNPFEGGGNLEKASELEGEPRDTTMRCDVCGERLTEGEEHWYCPNDALQGTPEE